MITFDFLDAFQAERGRPLRWSVHADTAGHHGDTSSLTFAAAL
jgi:hypothetical protein